MKTSPTQRTLAKLREDGWVCQVVEHWNAFARRRVDLFNGIDIIACRPGACLGVQCTTVANQAARLAKLRAEPKICAWLAAGNQVQVWGWAKRGASGKRKLWEVTVTDLTRQDLAATETEV